MDNTFVMYKNETLEYIYIYIFIYIFFKVNNWGKENLFKNIFVNILLCQFVKRLSFYHASKLPGIFNDIILIFSINTRISYYLPCVILLKKKKNYHV